MHDDTETKLFVADGKDPYAHPATAILAPLTPKDFRIEGDDRAMLAVGGVNDGADWRETEKAKGNHDVGHAGMVLWEGPLGGEVRPRLEGNQKIPLHEWTGDPV